MVRPAESIRKDLDALESATAALAEDFGNIYATYLTALGHTLRRQVIMATYHICTQVYPEKFLLLSVGDRAQLQKSVQNLGRKSQQWLHQLMEPEPIEAETAQRPDGHSLNSLEAALEILAQPIDSADPSIAVLGDEAAEPGDTGAAMSSRPAAAGALEEDQAAEPASAPDAENQNPEPSLELDPKQLLQSVIMAAMASDIEETLGGRPFTGDPLTPTLVAKHHLILERMLREVLQRVSRHANRILRKAKILPDLPEALLEMASEAEVGVPKGRSVPNVLNVMVAMSGDVAAEFDPRDDDDEAEDDDDDTEDDDGGMAANMTHLAAVHLRLTDLEFGDVQSALWRSKLRTSVGRLRKLGKQYQQAERELAIAQAEQAWRSVWYDDSSR